MTTWIDVMALAEALRAKRAAGRPLDGEDAARLLDALLDFHQKAVAWTPDPRPSSRGEPARGDR
jgi:hypothetical protein